MGRIPEWDKGRMTWDEFWMQQCQIVSLRSRDPSTKVGAHIVRPNQGLASFGYNGFPRGVHDLERRYADRELKYAMTVHAEVNAILNAGGIVEGCTLYVSPLFPCSTCAGIIIQAGISRVVYAMPEARKDWEKSFDISRTMFAEARVKVEEFIP